MMEQEYRISTYMRVLYGILGVGTFGFSIFIVSTLDLSLKPILLLLPLVFTGGGVLILINLFKRKIVIDEERIRCVNLFSTRELALTAIKGARVGQKTIRLEPISPGDRRIVIGNYSDLSNSEQLAKWARNNFKDLSAIDLEANEVQVLQDPNLGSTESERESVVKRKKELATVYNIVGLILGFWMIFLKGPSVALVLLLYPLAGILLMVFSKGIIKFVSDSKRSVCAFILLGFLLPCFILIIKSAGAYTLVQVSGVWLPGFGVAGIVCLLLYVFGVNRSIGGIGMQVVIMAVAALLYGFGAVRTVNCEFDRSVPEVYGAEVVDRRVDHGKSTTYYLILNPWGPRQRQEETEVSKGVFDHVAIGDTVNISLKEGVLHIPWFIVGKE